MDIILRPLKLEDKTFIFNENKGNIKNAFFSFGVAEDASRWVQDALQKIKTGSKIEWLGEINGKPIGMIGINNLDKKPEIGLWVVEEYQGKGVGRVLLMQAIKLITEWGVISQLYYYADKENLSSNKLALSCGFTLKESKEQNEYVLKLKKIEQET